MLQTINAPSFAELDDFDVGYKATSGHIIAPADDKMAQLLRNYYKYYNRPEKVLLRRGERVEQAKLDTKPRGRPVLVYEL